jgi:hypothetical protein
MKKVGIYHDVNNIDDFRLGKVRLVGQVRLGQKSNFDVVMSVKIILDEVIFP